MRGQLRISEDGSGRRVRLLLTAALLCAAALPLAFAVVVAPAQAKTETFNFTEGEQTFVVPAGVHRVHVLAVGGLGGNANATGGQAGEAEGDLSVSPGQTLYVEVGGNGESQGEGGEGGFNGGGDGAGGGGGASDVRTAPASSLLSLETRLIVAAGGGGGGGDGPSGFGGNGGAAGSGGETAEGGNEGGGAGTELAGGFGGSGCFSTGGEGEFGVGGAGGSSESGAPGGGGGGGLYGGGGGGGSCVVGSGGGGGGFSLIPPGGSTGLTSDAAFIQVSYNLPPTISITTPADGGTYTQGQSVAASYSCSAPAKTSVKSCSGSVANGAPIDTSTLGTHSFSVSAEDTDAGTATKTVSYLVVVPVPKAPETTLGSHPKKALKTNKKKVKVKFTFGSSEAGSTFECKLDKGAYAPCASPKTYKVKLGSHVFSVRAKSGGVADPTPATFRFKAKKKA